MKEKTMLVILTGILVMSFFGMAIAADLPLFPIATTKNANSVCLWTTSQSHSGTYSLHMDTGTIGTGDEAILQIAIFGGITLGDITTLSWWEYLVAGYPPHVDIVLDIDGDGNPDESLNFEYAYNSLSHYNTEAPMPYGALTGAWYQTFSDDGNGPSQIDDTTLAWPNSGPPGPPSSIQLLSLATWKGGVTLLSGSLGYVDANTVVLGFEIEIDNWVVNSEAYLDDVELNGVNILDYTGPKGDTGATGPRGLTGSRGATGSQGLQGLDGTNGTQGSVGSQGEIGPVGSKGDSGEAGVQGSIGPMGSKGETGDTGSQGSKGETGDTGSQGPKGDTGPQGEPAPESLAYSGVALGGISLLGLLYMLFKK